LKVLITGVNGFLGRNIAKSLSDSGFKILGIDIQEDPISRDLFQYHSGSILDKKFISNKIKDVDVVIHLAAITAHSEIIDKKYKTLDINLDGTKNVLSAFNSSKRSKKFIYASTGKVYGKISELPLTEKSNTYPINILGKSKLIAERLIDFYSTDDKAYITFRIFQAFGVGQVDHFLIPTIIKQINYDNRNIQKITLGDIKAKRDYIHVNDVANAFSLVVNSDIGPGNQIFNLSSGLALSAEEIVKEIEDLCDLKIHIQTDKSLFRYDEESIEYGSYAKAESYLGWKPKLSIREGLAKIIKEL
jgi:nucleoside-diphosphate-sugar epimerase